MHSTDALDRNYNNLACLRVENCQAARPEDREGILAKIKDLGEFNDRLQWLIFGKGGLIKNWMDAEGKVAGAGAIAARAAMRAQYEFPEEMEKEFALVRRSLAKPKYLPSYDG